VASDEIRKAAEQIVGMVQRMAMEIVVLPVHDRERQYAVVKQSLEEAARVLGQGPERTAEFVDMNYKAIRGLVGEIEAGGGAKGGVA
jgi:hypothetical protein